MNGLIDKCIDMYGISVNHQSNGVIHQGRNDKILLECNTSIKRLSDESWEITVYFNLNQAKSRPGLGIDLVIRYGEISFAFCSSAYFGDTLCSESTHKMKCTINNLNLAVGNYTIDAYICEPMRSWVEEHIAISSFEIAHQLGNYSSFELSAARDLGYVVPVQKWTQS